jgi:protein regulator of cytokinesis 1
MNERLESQRHVTKIVSIALLHTNSRQLFSALTEALHNQVRLVESEKNEMTDEAQRIITTIKQMEASLDDNKAHNEYEAEDEDLKITYPLLRCLQVLKEKHKQISRLHKERFEQVKSMRSLSTFICSRGI